MINNPSREIWLGGMQAGDLREWVTAMSLLSGLSQIGNHTPRKHEMFIWLMSVFFWMHGWFATLKLGLELGAIKWKLSCECVSYLKAGHILTSAHLFKYRLLNFVKESAHRVTLHFTLMREKHKKFRVVPAEFSLVARDDTLPFPSGSSKTIRSGWH